MTNRDTERDGCLSEVIRVLNREVDLGAIASLVEALRPIARPVSLSETVIAFDANVFLRLSSHPQSEDVIDFLRTSFDGALLLPGQVVQEFWNNQFLAVDSIAESIKKKAEALKGEIRKIDPSFADFSGRFEALLTEFQDSYGYIYDPNTLRRMQLFIDLISEKATVPYAPRNLLSEICESRKRTKTPPGFKDELDGDFYVWVDLLFGLSSIQRRGIIFNRVVFVSLDKKQDWVRQGTPHPILSAEIRTLTGSSFAIWSIGDLVKALLE